MTRLGGLSGLVAKGFNGHQHNWQRTTRQVGSQTFYLHVCLEHEPPEVRAYDVEGVSHPGAKAALEDQLEKQRKQGSRR